MTDRTIRSIDLPWADLVGADDFVGRHIGPTTAEQEHMLRTIGAASLDELLEQTVPASIRLAGPLALPAPRTTTEVLDELTTAFEKHAIDVPGKPERLPDTDAVIIDGFDLVSDQDLTHARRPPATEGGLVIEEDRKSTRLNSSHSQQSRMPSSA